MIPEQIKNSGIFYEKILFIKIFQEIKWEIRLFIKAITFSRQIIIKLKKYAKILLQIWKGFIIIYVSDKDKYFYKGGRLNEYFI